MAQGHGGRRAGAGRKPGTRNRSTAFIADQLAKDGDVTPLQVMVGAMRYYYRRAWFDEKGDALESPDASSLREAETFAKDAAPYMHPRLATHEVSGKGGGAIPVAVSGSVKVFLPDNRRRAA